MGIHLAMLAESIYWLQMIPSYTDRLVLQRMAKQALDPPGENGKPPCIYWAGRDPLILTLSDGTIPPKGSPQYKTQARKVSACLERLADAGAIKRIDEGHRGHNSVYRLTLGTSMRGT